MHSKLLTSCALAAVLMLSACGKKAEDSAATGSDPAAVATAGKTVDPCTILTTPEMAAITTDAVTATQPQDKGSCKYVSGQDDGTTVTIFASGGKHQMEIAHKSAQLLGGMGQSLAAKGGAGADTAALLKPDGSAVPALGDEQMWEANSTLAVRKGDAYVEVSPPIMHDPANHPGYPIISEKDKRAIAVAVAQKILAKIAS